MKRYTSLALIGVLVVGIAGFISLDAISATSFVTMKTASDIRETGQMLGHVTYELRDADGNIKHYFQSDNLIVDIGTDCAAQVIFDITGGDPTGANSVFDVCTPGSNGGFAFIAIGNSTNTFPLSSAEDTTLDVDANGNGEVKRSGYIDAVITAAASPNADTTVSIASPAFTFNELGPAGTKITQSGLFDASTGGNMFSARDIPGVDGTGLGVLNADTLSVTWTITLE